MNHDDAPALVAVAGIGALGLVCLAGAYYAQTTTVCRYIARRPALIALCGATAAHLAHVIHHERSTRQ